MRPCGDGTCSDLESGMCEADCGVCGNGICDPGEEYSCGSDCGLQFDFPPCADQPY